MELKCPQCGKWMAVSQEELVIHDSQVVCPQCLAVCRYVNGALVVRDDSDAPYRHTANVDASKHDGSKFCHSCGKQLPSGISFCPYCGADLSAPFSKPAAVNTIKQPTPAPVQETPKPQPAAPKTEQPKPESRQTTSNHVEEKLRTMSRTHQYNSSGIHRLHQHGTMPGKTFKIIAYFIIALLLVLLVGIIVAGLNIEPAV